MGKVIGIIGCVQVAVLSAAVGAEPPTRSIRNTGLSPSTVVVAIPPETERWKKLAVATFQGLANRNQGTVYTLWGEREYGPLTQDEKAWLDRFKLMYNLQSTDRAVDELPELLRGDFKHVARGILLYPDEVINAKSWSPLINVYAFLSGANDLIPVPKSQRRLFPFLDVCIDATTASWGTDASKAYRFAYDSCKDVLLTNQTLAHNHPSILRMVDFYVANMVLPLFYWQGIPAETQSLFATILQETGPNKTVIGCWNVPRWNIPDFEEQANPPGEEHATIPIAFSSRDEHEMVKLLNSYGKRMLCSSESGVANLSFTEKMPLLTARRAHDPEVPMLDKSKVYVAFTLTDGDNLIFWTKERGFADWLLNQQSHDIPLQWSFQIAFIDLMPGLVSYLYSNASGKNSFAAGVSGYGYVMTKDFATRYPRQREQLLRQHFAHSAKLMQRIGQRAVWWYYDYDDNKPEIGSGLEEARWFVQEAGNYFIPTGLFNGYGRGSNYSARDANFFIDSVPCFSNLRAPVPGGASEELSSRIIADSISEMTKNLPKPLFVNFTLHPNQSRGMVKAMQILGDGYVAVNGEALGSLYRQTSK